MHQRVVENQRRGVVARRRRGTQFLALTDRIGRFPGQVLQILERPATRRNCLEIAQQCGMVVPPMPSASTVLEAVLPVITGQADSAEPLFAKNEEGGKSLYDLRNDIAHGNHCDHELEFTDLVDKRLRDMRRFSRDVLWRMLQRIPSFEGYFQP